MARMPDGAAVRHTQTGWTGVILRRTLGEFPDYVVTWDRSGLTGHHAAEYIEPLPDSHYTVLPMPERFARGNDLGVPKV